MPLFLFAICCPLPCVLARLLGFGLGSSANGQELAGTAGQGRNGQELAGTGRNGGTGHGEVALPSRRRLSVNRLLGRDCDHDTAITVRDALTLDDAADGAQQLGDLRHEAVFRLDSRLNRIHLGSRRNNSSRAGRR